MAAVCRKPGMRTATSRSWDPEYGGTNASEGKRLRAFEEVTAQLERRRANALLDRPESGDAQGGAGL